MSDLRVPLPPELEPFRHDLEYFMSTMVRKLHTNRHKGSGRDYSPSEMLAGAFRELEEVEKARNEQGQFEVAIECADVANFMFLMARGVWNMTRDEFKKDAGRS